MTFKASKVINIKSVNHTLLYSAIAAAIYVAPCAVTTVTAGPLEEVVVTARKREESLQDVPVSVQAYSGDAIQSQGIADMQSLAPSVPNFSYSQAVGASDVLIMRGLGTVGSGPHLEQAVGQVFNGFFTTRSRMGRAALIDLAQVEVLRGPQGPIIGKNTSLGAINITSQKPTDELEIAVSGGYDFDASEGYELQGVVSGPLSDAIRGRAVVNIKDKDGWMENRPSGEDHRSKEDQVARLMLDWDVTESLTAEFIYQYTDFDQVGKPREIDWCGDAAAAEAFSGEDCRLNGVNNGAAVLADGTDVGEVFQMEANLYGATLNWDFENFTLSSLTGYTDYEMFDRFDSDLTPDGPRVIANQESFEQFSQEFRIVSNGGEVLDYVAGINYMSSDMVFTQDFDNHTNRRRHELANVESDSVSVFGQVDWHLAEQWNLTVGARWTNEERECFKDQWQNDYATDVRNDSRCGPERSGLISCFDNPLVDEIDESAVSWNSSLQWEYDSSSMIYLSAATGFKSSGFNIRQNVEIAATQENFVFDEEESFNIELGGKHELFDSSVRFNWTLYRTEIEGLQLSANDPENITQAVVNGDASATGLEYELLWAATDALTLSLNGAFNKTEYDDFLGDCYNGQSEAQGCSVDVNGDGLGDFQDLAGEAPPFAPDYTLVVGADYVWPLGDNMELTAGVKAYQVDEQMLAVDNDPRAQEDKYTKWDANLTLTDMEGHWKVALVGRNLTNKLVRSWSEGTSAFNSVGGARYAFIDETRAIAVRGEYRF